MGYETTMILVEEAGALQNLWQVLASVELSKVAYGKLGELIKSSGHKVPGELKATLEEYEKRVDGEGVRDYEKEVALERKLAKHLRHIYWNDQNSVSFTDTYGDLLLFADLDQVLESLQSERVRCAKEERIYYDRFDWAIALVREMILSETNGRKRKIKVVLWGH